MPDASKGHLQEVIDRLREQIVKNISANLPKGYLALGPALMFIEDPLTRCLYNWSDVKWEELKLGALVKELLRDIYDVTRFIETIKQRELPDISSDFAEIKEKSKLLLEKEADMSFDNYPLFKDRFDHNDEFEKFTFDVQKTFSLIPSTDLGNFLKYNTVRKFDFLSLGKFLGDIHRIGKGRYFALLKLKDIISAYDANKLKLIGEFIERHPRYRLKGHEDIVTKWFDFVERIKNFPPDDYDLEISSYDRLMRDAIEIFCFLPQESYSSDALLKLKQINSDQNMSRADRFNIRLTDLAYHPIKAAYDIESMKSFKLYFLTHFFERLFYGNFDSNFTKSEIKNIVFLPIKFLDAQVIGQIVLISSEPIDYKLIVDSVETFLPSIKEAAKIDFETDMFLSAITDAKSQGPKALLDETVYIAECLGKIVTYRGLAVLKYDKVWTVSRITERESLRRHGINHTILRLSDVTARRQNKYAEFLLWFGGIAKQTQEGAKGAFMTLDSHDATQLRNVFEDIKIKSYYILVVNTDWNRIGIVIGFEETADLARLSGEDLYWTIVRSLEKIFLIKQKQLIDLEKIAILHDWNKDFPKIQGELLALKRDIAAKSESTDHVDRALRVLRNYDMRTQGIRTKSFKDYFAMPETRNYNLKDKIESELNDYILNSDYINYTAKKIRNKHNSYELVKFWDAGHRIVDLRVEELETSLNIDALRYLLGSLVENAIIHTDWNIITSKKRMSFAPIIIEGMEQDRNMVIRIANVPARKDMPLDDEGYFFRHDITPQLRTIGRVYEAAAGNRHILFRNYKGKYICVEMTITVGRQRSYE